MKNKRCEECGKKFITSLSHRKYCSPECKSLGYLQHHKVADAKYRKKLSSKGIKRIRQPFWKKPSFEKMLWSDAKRRAKKKGLEFSLKLTDIKIPKMCPLLGIEIIKGVGKCWGNSPSLDRKDPTKGYTPDNVWVISHRANTSKSYLTLEELKVFVKNLEMLVKI